MWLDDCRKAVDIDTVYDRSNLPEDVDKWTIAEKSETKVLGIHKVRPTNFSDWAQSMALSLAELVQSLFHILTLGLLDVRVFYYERGRKTGNGLTLLEYLVFDLFDDEE